MNRDLTPFVKKDLDTKIVLLTGPRQSGKTTLARMLYPSGDYFNFDYDTDRLSLQQKKWNREGPIVIFDELHKMKEWKRWVKGIFDVEGVRPRLLVTGSARMDTYRKVGDSLAGRFFQYRLHPFDSKEVKGDPEETLAALLHYGGFPEPFLKGSTTFYKKWRKSHLESVLRQDLLDIFSVRDIKAIETLVALLRERVGAPVSYSNLGRTLERDPATIKRWLEFLETVYVIFRVTPYSKQVARSLLKEPKYYFYDAAQVKGEGPRLENIVALSLLKELQFLEDTQGEEAVLHYLRTKDGLEVDFAIVINQEVTHLIEVKTSDAHVSKALYAFPAFQGAQKCQLVYQLKRSFSTLQGVQVASLAHWLAACDLSIKGSG